MGSRGRLFLRADRAERIEKQLGKIAVHKPKDAAPKKEKSAAKVHKK
jgi:hypothetical protein